MGPGGDQAVSSRPSDQRQRTPDGGTCCDGDVARRVDDGWQNPDDDDDDDSYCGLYMKQ